MKLDKRKKITRFDFATKPHKSIILSHVATAISKVMLMKNKPKTEKINMEGLKPPYLLLSSHASFNDFLILYATLGTNKFNFVIALDGYKDIGNFLVKNIGGIAKLKFLTQIALMKNMKYAADKLKNVVVMYPEARYSLDGTDSYIPPSLGKLVKFLNIPVVIATNKGSFLSYAQWNKYYNGKEYKIYKDVNVPYEVTYTQIVKQEEIDKLSVDEINERIKATFKWDDWKYLRERDFKLSLDTRAENLNSILYQCPKCKVEYKMLGKGTNIKCTACGKEWNLDEKGILHGLDGVTEFEYVPDWFNWERENVKKEVYDGKYNVELKCKVYTLPSYQGYVPQKDGVFKQDSSGTTLEVNLYGEDKVIKLSGTQLESIHVEYWYQDIGDCIEVNVKEDCIWFNIIGYKDEFKDRLTKISLATEAIRDLAKEKL